jgi:RNA polymerase sigma factor (TIGR02999 family)
MSNAPPNPPRSDAAGAATLLPLVYDELRRLAAAKMAGEGPGHALGATDLVHEAYLRLAGGQRFGTRAQFFAAAAEAMRRILIDHARQRLAGKRGGGAIRLPFVDALHVADSPEGLVALNDALEALAVRSPARADLVKLRFFAGLTMPEAALALGVSLATAERWWTYARAWLFAELDEAKSENP